MSRIPRVSRTAGLVALGVLMGGVLAWSGVSAAHQLSGAGSVNVVTESRSVPHGYLATNVVCPKGQRAISGGYAYHGDHDLANPVIVEVSAPGRTSDQKNAVYDSWDLFFLNGKNKKITVEVHVVCTPI
ncbi:hypothetical protein OIE66_10880 [Nonomuraea sp. NBC_01738]|uniref:hypothetical protein n=1 Tax=Nonomuraea sp. NBC_01738 TaxID=2976003 RepID=UPI002E14E30D|nr:hypothetical protein OIE66_10880 [Nonomuraea sp. NBC_01738]